MRPNQYIPHLIGAELIRNNLQVIKEKRRPSEQRGWRQFIDP